MSSSLSRAQSWPLLAANAAAAAETSKGTVPGARAAQLQARRLLCRHYYLEGGWGWVVTTCSVLVHILSHGMQLACSQLVTPASRKFQVPAIHAAGKRIFVKINLLGLGFLLGLVILYRMIYSTLY